MEKERGAAIVRGKMLRKGQRDLLAAEEISLSGVFLQQKESKI